jgi:hypothetical protein
MQFCDNCGKEINDSDVKNYTTQSGMQLQICEKCLNNYLGKTKLHKIKKDRTIKLVVILLIMIVILGAISVSGFYILNDSYSALKTQIYDLENTLNNTQSTLNIKISDLDSKQLKLQQLIISCEENTSYLSDLKSGNQYTLHDPLMSEITEFIKNDGSDNESELIKNAKNQGIRCAYVEVGIVGTTIRIVGAPLTDKLTRGMYPLVFFRTVDNTSVYFECKTDYRIFPQVGKKYVDCVQGHPYSSGFFTNDTITKINIMW